MRGPKLSPALLEDIRRTLRLNRDEIIRQASVGSAAGTSWEEKTVPHWQNDWTLGASLYMQALKRAGLAAPEFDYEESYPPGTGNFRLRIRLGNGGKP